MTIPPKTFLVLSETTLLPLLYFGLTGRDVHIVWVLPHVRFLRAPLRRIAALAIRFGLARGRHAISDELPWIEGLPGDGYYNDIHQSILTRLHEIYPLPAEGSPITEYGYAMRKCLSDYSADVISVLVLIKWVEENWAPGTWRLIGAPPYMKQVYQLYFDREPAFRAVGGNILLPLYNLLNALLFCAATLGWLFMRVRLSRTVPRKYHLALDSINPVFERELLKRAVDKNDDALVVYRTKVMRRKFGPDFAEFNGCMTGDARISGPIFLRLLASMIRDMWRMWKVASVNDPGLFGRYSTMVGKRAMFAAFFNKFQPRFLLGRDDYSIDHIIRNQELRKIGGTSIGLMHGMPLNSYASQWTEVDFDINLVFGLHLYTKYYADLWPSHMKVIGTGCFRMNAKYFAQRHKPRPKDIAYFAIVHGKSDLLMQEVLKIANHFRDRIVYVKFKPGRGAEDQAQFERQTKDAPDNVVVYQEPNAYDLLMKVSYALGAGTTVSVEAIAFGVKSYSFDVERKFKKYYLRNFPNIIVTTAEDVIKRIEEDESGIAAYRFDELNDLIATPDQDFCSVFREIIAA